MLSAMKSKIVLLLALCILLVSGQSDPNYRLNSLVRPSSYALYLTTYFDTGDEKAFTFDGYVEITISTQEENVSQIKLHSEDLNFTSANITVARGSTVLQLDANNPLAFDTNYTFVYINLQDPLQVGVDHTLTILYTGPIRNDLKGFYRSYYFEQGVKKWLGATQMEPTHARKVFPCFDEPEYKATFTIIIDRPSNYTTTLSNMQLQTSQSIEENYVRDTFFPSPVMSSYLVAFLVSEFSGATSNNTARPFGVYSRPEALDQTGYAVDVGIRILDAFSDYFGIDYYSTNANIKLDHIAVPDFNAGAMENWGLIKYREGLILFVPDESTPYYEYRVAQIIAHESAHLWFGDLVTCHWWSNTWLNEGFANYFENYITQQVEPDLGSEDISVTSSLYEALSADQVPSAPALTNENVNSPNEISGHFGTVTYSKGGTVIRMMHHLIGDEAFKQGLHEYLDTNKFEMGTTTKLYEALEFGVNNFSNFSSNYPGHNITSVMSSWVTQAGFPILTVHVDHETNSIHLEQERFYINDSNKSDEIYQIPITYTTEVDSNFNNTVPSFIMDNETYTIANVSNLSEDTWVIFNIKETGYYRVNYDEDTWKQLSRGLKGNSRTNIHYLNRAKIVNDLYAFLRAEVVEFGLVYDIYEFLTQETEYTVWIPALRSLSSLRSMYKFSSNDVSRIDLYSLHLLDGVIADLGLDVRQNDSHTTIRNRQQILEYVCRIGHQGCIDQAVSLFRQFKDNGVPISPSLRSISYCYGLRNGDGNDFDFLWDRMISTNVANEAIIIQSALGCTRVEEKLLSYLRIIMEEDSPIRTQDLTAPLSSVLQDPVNVPIALDFVKRYYVQLSEIYPTMGSILGSIASAMTTEVDIQEFEAWLDNCEVCSSSDVSSVKASIRNIQATTEWAKNKQSAIIAVLPGAAALHTPSLLAFILVSLLRLVLQY